MGATGAAYNFVVKYEGEVGLRTDRYYGVANYRHEPGK
jgi:hypothetical protein